MGERDELIKILHQEATADRVKNSPPRNVPVVAAKVEAAADAILTSGYRKPRTITTEDGLRVLPEGSVVLGWAVGGLTPYLRVRSARGRLVWGCVGSADIYQSVDLLQQRTPATVLYEPEATK